MGTVVYLIGLFCCVWCIWDLFSNKHIETVWKIVISILLLASSWLGLALYYFIFRNMIR